MENIQEGAIMEKRCNGCKGLKPLSSFDQDKRNRDGRQGLCKECRSDRYWDRHREHNRVCARDYWRRIKLEMITAYGGKCVCCGESNPEFLSLDHANGGGNRHRAVVGGCRGVYRELKKKGWPQDGYRLLCYNCNLSIGFYGYCPHQRNS